MDSKFYTKTQLTWTDSRGIPIEVGDTVVQEGCGLTKWQVAGEANVPFGVGRPWLTCLTKDRLGVQHGVLSIEEDFLKINPEWSDSQIILHAGICGLELYRKGTKYDSRPTD